MLRLNDSIELCIRFWLEDLQMINELGTFISVKQLRQLGLMSVCLQNTLRDVVLPVDNLLKPRMKYQGDEMHKIILQEKH